MAVRPTSRALTHPALLFVLHALVRAGLPVAIVCGLMYESWAPLAWWFALTFAAELLLWLDRNFGLRPRARRGPPPPRH